MAAVEQMEGGEVGGEDAGEADAQQEYAQGEQGQGEEGQGVEYDQAGAEGVEYPGAGKRAGLGTTARGAGAAPLTHGQARHACCSRCAQTSPVLQLEGHTLLRESKGK